MTPWAGDSQRWTSSYWTLTSKPLTDRNLNLFCYQNENKITCQNQKKQNLEIAKASNSRGPTGVISIIQLKKVLQFGKGSLVQKKKSPVFQKLLWYPEIPTRYLGFSKTNLKQKWKLVSLNWIIFNGNSFWRKIGYFFKVAKQIVTQMQTNFNVTTVSILHSVGFTTLCERFFQEILLVKEIVDLKRICKKTLKIAFTLTCNTTINFKIVSWSACPVSRFQISQKEELNENTMLRQRPATQLNLNFTQSSNIRLLLCQSRTAQVLHIFFHFRIFQKHFRVIGLIHSWELKRFQPGWKFWLKFFYDNGGSAEGNAGNP